MTTASEAPRSWESRIIAVLGGPDNRDIPNEIHSTEGAKDYGYRAALVGGATVFGWTVPAIIDGLGERWLEDGWIEVVFRRPTYPGDEMTARVSDVGGGAFDLRMENQDGEGCIVGTLGLGRGPFLDELHMPRRLEPEDRPSELPHLTMDVAPVGEDIRPMRMPAGATEMVEYARDKARTEAPLFTGEHARLHPGWIAAVMIRLLHHSYDYGPAIHAKSHIQHLAPAEIGQTLTVAGHFVETYERKGHHYGVIDGVILGEDGRELIRIRHTTIYEVAKRDSA
jgi:acyl dehydratase